MSAFLGPIHYWLYRKIQLQEELIEALAELSEKEHWEEISKDGLRESTVRRELRPLNELIDITNIHGWLQERIQDVEGRYALLVTALLKADPSRITALEEEAFRFGKAHRLPESSDLSDAYRTLKRHALRQGQCSDRAKRCMLFLGADRGYPRGILESGRGGAGKLLPPPRKAHGRNAGRLRDQRPERGSDPLQPHKKRIRREHVPLQY